MNTDFVLEKAQAIGEHVLAAAVTFIIGLIIIDLILMFIDKTASRSRLDKIVVGYLRICVKTVLFIILAVIVLSTLGVSVVSLVALLSAAAAAIALGLQNSLSNLAAGILIIVNKPFVAGDFIESAGQSGVVDEIHLFNCRLHTLDNKYVVVPNNTLIGNVIVNCSRKEARRVDVKVNIGYGDDIDQARRVLLDIAAANEKILQDPEPFVGVAAHKDASVELDFRAWCASDNYWPVFYYLQEEVLRRFKQEDISIPYPQLDVHIEREV